jgi:hypothetical protein
MIKNKTHALEIVGGLSKPGKMPGYGWSIPAKNCPRGSLLAKKPGTICSNCYAMKGRYAFSNVQNALENRLTKLNDPLWIDAMTFLLKDEKYFRWFDSGDLQSTSHLDKIVKVCENTPNCEHWLPTREIRTLILFLDKGGKFPSNLCVRVSADEISKYPVAEISNCKISTTSIDNNNEWANNPKYKVHDCPVAGSKNIKTCEQAGCTACWKNSVDHINYKLH